MTNEAPEEWSFAIPTLEGELRLKAGKLQQKMILTQYSDYGRIIHAETKWCTVPEVPADTPDEVEGGG